MKTDALRRTASRLAATVREMNEAQRRMIILRTAQDRYMDRPDTPPDTYAEFLARTSGVLLHEPSAACRQSRLPYEGRQPGFDGVEFTVAFPGADENFIRAA
jgi:hypothetical protein